MSEDVKELLRTHRRIKEVRGEIAKQTIMGNSTKESQYELNTLATRQDLLLDSLVEEYSGEL